MVNAVPPEAPREDVAENPPGEPAEKPPAKLRILIAADTYPPDVNGAAVFSHRLAKNMAARGHEVHIAAARTSRGPDLVEETEEATVHRFRSFKAPTHEYIRLCLPWLVEPAMGRLMDELQPDVVHAQCHYMIGKAAIDAAAERGLRTIATNHFMPENLDPFLPFPGWFRRIVAKNSWRDMGRLMGKAAVVTTPTPLAAQTMMERAGFEKVLPLSNGIDVEYYRQRPDEVLNLPERPTVLFVGRLAVEKNVDVLIEAIGKTDPALGIGLDIVGDGEQRDRLAAQIQELGLGDRVRMRGHVGEDALRRAYLEADVFCQPGTAELQSLVSLEAMSSGLPVVLADALALPHLVEEGVNGYLFEPGNSAHLAARLEQLFATGPEQRTAMGERSRERAGRHSLNTTMNAFEKLYRGADWIESRYTP
ncbi:glycosyltransferase [Nesterenkonia sp. E16_7]|uniref:glycosyltransferase n=1 Tax=unclassified Nesterenkonia TaxID=2629769 RepID=UPI001A90EBFA|nr:MULTISPECIES: glycosyltransferase [unclassified Nesterenkonia]MBO0595658.1 glycosyltransferase [Nesterenkonia sp. E16_10]MBO0598535.1 glycosyltransferase [Nesterenkonia sp. E16_7]